MIEHCNGIDGLLWISRKLNSQLHVQEKIVQNVELLILFNIFKNHRNQKGHSFSIVSAFFIPNVTSNQLIQKFVSLNLKKGAMAVCNFLLWQTPYFTKIWIYVLTHRYQYNKRLKKRLYKYYHIHFFNIYTFQFKLLSARLLYFLRVFNNDA